MKRLPRGKTLLVIAVALTMLLFSGLVVGGQIREAISSLTAQREELQTEYDRLQKINDARADYENQTRRFDEAFSAMTAKFPARITQNNQILFLRDIEDEFGIRIASASYTDPEAVYRFQYLSPGNEESYQLVRSTLQFPMTLSYDEWKRFIVYIEETDGCSVIESVSTDYDADEALVDADVTILQYAVTGADRTDGETATDVETGTDNIFSSGARFYTGGEEYAPYDVGAWEVSASDAEEAPEAGDEEASAEGKATSVENDGEAADIREEAEDAAETGDDQTDGGDQADEADRDSAGNATRDRGSSRSANDSESTETSSGIRSSIR